MTSTFLFTIEDYFDLGVQGVVIVPGVPDYIGITPGAALELRPLLGPPVRSRVHAVQVPVPRKTGSGFPISLPPETPLAYVDKGTSVWLVET